MTKFLGLAALMAAMGVTLVTPISSEAGGRLFRRSYYVEPSYSPPVVNSYPSGSSTVVPAPSTTYYYPAAPVYSSGYYRTDGGRTSGWYRVGNVIINGRRWGDIGYRYSHADLLQW
jgi:hypothetical protein